MLFFGYSSQSIRLEFSYVVISAIQFVLSLPRSAFLPPPKKIYFRQAARLFGAHYIANIASLSSLDSS